LTLTQVCQLEWASMELKPKHTTPRLNTLLQKKAIEAIEGSASASDIIDILQGFRQRKNKDMYQRVVKQLIARKAKLFPTDGDQKARAESVVNLLYSLASNRPTQFGIFKNYAAEDVDELLSHYEQDLKDAVVDGHLDGDHLTRLVQTLYLFKSGEFEGIYRRIEKRAVALNTEGKLSVHNCTNILRSFSHG